MWTVQCIKLVYTDFWSPYLAQNGARVHLSKTDVTQNPRRGQFCPPSMLVHCRSCMESDVGTMNKNFVDKLLNNGWTRTQSEKYLVSKKLATSI